ncbi:hypothetical protein HOG98_00280 [bacterium]|nr:hypothetical protein [bacterium]
MDRIAPNQFNWASLTSWNSETSEKQEKKNLRAEKASYSEVVGALDICKQDLLVAHQRRLAITCSTVETNNNVNHLGAQKNQLGQDISGEDVAKLTTMQADFCSNQYGSECVQSFNDCPAIGSNDKNRVNHIIAQIVDTNGATELGGQSDSSVWNTATVDCNTYEMGASIPEADLLQGYIDACDYLTYKSPSSNACIDMSFDGSTAGTPIWSEDGTDLQRKTNIALSDLWTKGLLDPFATGTQTCPIYGNSSINFSDLYPAPTPPPGSGSGSGYWTMKDDPIKILGTSAMVILGTGLLVYGAKSAYHYYNSYAQNATHFVKKNKEAFEKVATLAAKLNHITEAEIPGNKTEAEAINDRKAFVLALNSSIEKPNSPAPWTSKFISDHNVVTSDIIEGFPNIIRDEFFDALRNEIKDEETGAVKTPKEIADVIKDLIHGIERNEIWDGLRQNDVDNLSHGIETSLAKVLATFKLGTAGMAHSGKNFEQKEALNDVYTRDIDNTTNQIQKALDKNVSDLRAVILNQLKSTMLAELRNGNIEKYANDNAKFDGNKESIITLLKTKCVKKQSDMNERFKYLVSVKLGKLETALPSKKLERLLLEKTVDTEGVITKPLQDELYSLYEEIFTNNFKLAQLASKKPKEKLIDHNAKNAKSSYIPVSGTGALEVSEDNKFTANSAELDNLHLGIKAISDTLETVAQKGIFISLTQLKSVIDLLKTQLNNLTRDGNDEVTIEKVNEFLNTDIDNNPRINYLHYRISLVSNSSVDDSMKKSLSQEAKTAKETITTLRKHYVKSIETGLKDNEDISHIVEPEDDTEGDVGSDSDLSEDD